MRLLCQVLVTADAGDRPREHQCSLPAGVPGGLSSPAPALFPDACPTAAVTRVGGLFPEAQSWGSPSEGHVGRRGPRRCAYGCPGEEPCGVAPGGPM